MNVASRMRIEPLEDIDEIGPGIDAVKFATFDERECNRCILCPDLTPAEEPVLATERYGTDSSLDVIVGDRNLRMEEILPKLFLSGTGVGHGVSEKTHRVNHLLKPKRIEE